MKSIYYLLRALIKTAYAIHPAAGNHIAFRLFTRPLFQIKKKEEIHKLSTAIKTSIPFEGESIKIYQFGRGTIPILLIHGWRGHSGNFIKIIESFNPGIYKIIAFDAPAHNRSTGSSTNVFQFVRLTKEIITRYNPRYIIAHSMGSAVAVTALRELARHRVEKLVLLSTPNSLRYLVESFANGFQFTDFQKKSFSDYVQKKLNRTFDQSKVQHQIIYLDIPVLLIHDEHDRVLPIEEASTVASAYQDKIDFMVLNQVGHYKMLSDPHTIQKTKSFITGQYI